jgi:solute carrier family 13 (sodium-dependent dicarboxylate transporter), member 2/3/5
LGLALPGLMLLFPPPQGMSEAAWWTTAVAALMAIWWVTEAIPIPATALVPLVLFPVIGVRAIGDVAPAYANPVIFLFMGGFVLALAMERCDLHRRIALRVVRFVGTRPHRLILGFMGATGFLSMWVSNTATTVMMLPIALSVVHLISVRGIREQSTPERNLALGLMLGVAYASSIGGLATLIGTPPNALLAAFLLETYDVQIGFAQWMLVGVPLVLVTLPITWFVLARLIYPVDREEIRGGRQLVEEVYRSLGPTSPAQVRVAMVFVVTALLWIVRPLLDGLVPGLSDTGIAIAAAVSLFMIPSGDGRSMLMDWRTAERLPWGVLLLFGGGLALAGAVQASGLAEWIGNSVGGLGLPTIAMVLVVTLVTIFLTELTSNTATAAAFLPLLAGVAVGIGENPLLLVVPAALAATCAFMLPVATPPNAIVYGSGYVTVPQMVRAGVWLNAIFALAITALAYSLVVWVFGVEIGTLPEWAQPGSGGAP